MTVDLRTLSHESLVAAVSGRLGGTPRMTAAALDSFYVRDRSVPAARIETYKRPRRVRDVVASTTSVEAAPQPGDVSYASFFVEPESIAAHGDREMAVAS